MPGYRWLRFVPFLLPGVASAAACDRPDWQLSDTAPVVGRGGSATGTAGTVAAEACLLDSSKGATPVFWGQTVLNASTARREVYAYVNDAEAAQLRAAKTLFPASSLSAPQTSAAYALLAARASTASAEQKPLLEALQQRFKTPRSSWPNLWALRLVKNPGSEHMNPVRIVFREDAWFGRITDKGSPVIVDIKNQIVSPEAAALEPGRVAAMFVVVTPQTSNIYNCEQGYRDFSIPDERMIESWSLATAELLERLDADIQLLTDLFGVVRSCATVDRGSMTFHSTVCNAWSSFGAQTEYMAYGWSLANPAELYKPTAQNLLGLVDALERDRFEPAPFVVEPDRNVAGGGAGGSAGASGAGGFGGGGGFAARRAAERALEERNRAKARGYNASQKRRTADWIARSTSSCKMPRCLRLVLVLSRPWSPLSTTKSSLGAVMRRRTSSSSGSAHKLSRVPCTNRTGARSSSNTWSRSLPFCPRSG
jgi:hypothetical protein